MNCGWIRNLPDLITSRKDLVGVPAAPHRKDRQEITVLPEDEKRLQREADIAKAKRGPDYSMRDSAIARNKAAEGKRDQAQAAENARSRTRSAILAADHNRIHRLRKRSRTQ